MRTRYDILHPPCVMAVCTRGGFETSYHVWCMCCHFTWWNARRYRTNPGTFPDESKNSYFECEGGGMQSKRPKALQSKALYSVIRAVLLTQVICSLQLYTYLPEIGVCIPMFGVWREHVKVCPSTVSLNAPAQYLWWTPPFAHSLACSTFN
jgi:hypothetical protein